METDIYYTEDSAQVRTLRKQIERMENNYNEIHDHLNKNMCSLTDEKVAELVNDCNERLTAIEEKKEELLKLLN